MSQLKNIKRWFWWHRWTSLVCTVFLLMLCLTGLPLIFQEEITQFLSKEPPYVQMAKNTPMANLDSMIRIAQHRYPAEVVTSAYVDDDEPQFLVSMIPKIDADDKLIHTMQFDVRTAKLLKDEPPSGQQPATFIGLMFDLHIDMFAGLPGELFLGFIGLLFVISIISGIVLYGPFMKKIDFGTLRNDRSKRLKWLDLHNLLGIATAIWLLVVGATGVMNELSTPLFGLWQITDVKAMLDRYHGKPVVKQNELSSIQAAYDTAKKALPAMTVTSIVYPGNAFGSPYHFLLWAKGNTPLTSRLFSPVLVDAKTGELAVVVKMPFYLRALEISRPLHFGDYGGTPLKVIWVLFDLIAILVLISGIYLWFDKRKSYRDIFMKLESESHLENNNNIL